MGAAGRLSPRSAGWSGTVGGVARDRLSVSTAQQGGCPGGGGGTSGLHCGGGCRGKAGRGTCSPHSEIRVCTSLSSCQIRSVIFDHSQGLFLSAPASPRLLQTLIMETNGTVDRVCGLPTSCFVFTNTMEGTQASLCVYLCAQKCPECHTVPGAIPHSQGAAGSLVV